MTFIDRIENVLGNGRRDFKPGAGAITDSDMYFGTDPDEWSPAEYGDYLATSNAVYTCATIRADLLKSIDLRAYRLERSTERKARQVATSAAAKQEITTGPIIDLLTKVNPFWTFRRLISMTSLSLDLWGKSFWFLERGQSGKGFPKEIWWARGDRVRVVPDPKNYIGGFLYEPMDGGKPIPFSVDETIYFRFPNPLDEFDGLSPLAAARLAADVGSAAGKANVNLFKQGMMLGGLITPTEQDMTLSPDQAKALERQFDTRFRGVDKAHRWAVLRFNVQMMGASQLGFSPKDAEFLGSLRWSLEEVGRAYKIPPDLIGGERTYQNVDAAMKAVWIHAGKPLGDFLADELTEQLIPKLGMMPAVDLFEFDYSEVEVLQEAESDRWARESEQIKNGAITINEWREEQGKEPVEWGNVFWAPFNLVPVSSDLELAPAPETPPGDAGDAGNPEDETDNDEEARIQVQVFGRAVEYGSELHKVLWRRFERRESVWEKQVTDTTVGLFERLQDSVLDTLKSRAKKRGPEEAALNPFDLTRWIRIFRETIRPVYREIIGDAGETALIDLGVEMTFDVDHPKARSFLELRSQRFAEAVPETTWKQLQESLSAGMTAGEGIPELEERVLSVMADRIRSTPETIARTETVGAMNGGTLLGYEQSGVVEEKAWLAALDSRTRDSHIQAHMDYSENGSVGPIALQAEFLVGAGSGPAPGQIGVAEEDINCRCTIIPIVTERAGGGKGRSNGHVRELSGILERMKGLTI